MIMVHHLNILLMLASQRCKNWSETNHGLVEKGMPAKDKDGTATIRDFFFVVIIVYGEINHILGQITTYHCILWIKYLQVLIQGENTGIEYQYNLAITNHSMNGTEFVWQYTPWSECSKSCAKGIVTCHHKLSFPYM